MERQKPMSGEFDRFVRELQEEMLRDYSDELKREFLNPRNVGKIEHSDGYASVTGVCGDTIEMSLLIEDGTISDIAFMTDGCGFTIVCASYVTRTAKGRTLAEALQISPEDVEGYFESLPEGHEHCAKLSVMTLRAAMENYRNKLAGAGEKGKAEGLTV
jgi:nitrogen fixation protein NifU and related proteins